MPVTSVPSVANILAFFDAFASQLKVEIPAEGFALRTETNTGSALATAALNKALGTSSTAGILPPAIAASLSDALNAWVGASRVDARIATRGRAISTIWDNLISGNLPTGWRLTDSTIARTLDAFLLRANGCNAGAPTKPAAAGTLTAVTNANGALYATSAGSAPRVVHTLVGSADYYESLPSAEATQVAIAGTQSAYQYAIAGTVPAGVTKVRMWRGQYGGVTGLYGWDQDVAVTAGSSYPTIMILQPDALLRLDWTPPSWLSGLMVPEAALLFALAFGASSPVPGGPLMMIAQGMFSATNVAIGPINGFLGLGNSAAPNTGTFGATTIGTGFVAGAIQTTNNAPSGIQGFLGATGLRARVTSALSSSSRLPTISYTYYDAAHGFGNVQTATGQTPSTNFATGALGDTAIYTIPAGQIVRSVTETSATGSASSGTYLYEGVAPRAY